MNRKAAAFILVFCMLVFSFSASASSAIGNIISRLNGDETINYSIQVEFGKLPQFSDDRTEQLNQIMKHIDFTGSADGSRSSLSVRLDGKTLFSLTETDLSGSTDMILFTSPSEAYMLPEETGLRGSSYADLLFRTLTPVQSEITFYMLLDDYVSLFRKLPDVFREKSKEAKINEKYRNYGTAAKKTTVTLSAEEMQSWLQNIPESLSSKYIYIPLQSLRFENRQVFTMYFTADGSLIKIVYSGSAGLSEDDMRSVRLEWKTSRTETGDRDEITLRTPNSRNTKRNNIILSYERKTADDGTETFLWKEEKNYLSGGIRTRSLFSADLTLENSILSGTLTRSDTVRNSVSSEEIIFSCFLTDSGPYDGTLEINHKKDKIERDRLNIRFALSAGNTVKDSESVPEAVTLTEEKAGEVLQHVMSGIVQKLFTLPEEDLVFLKDGIPDELWKEITAAGNN